MLINKYFKSQKLVWHFWNRKDPGLLKKHKK